MFEIDDEIRRRNFLARLGGVEETAFLRFNDEKIMGIHEADIDLTSSEGKASAVQFIRFPFTDEQVKVFNSSDTEIIIGFNHTNYSHMAVMSISVKEALAKDFD